MADQPMVLSLAAKVGTSDIRGWLVTKTGKPSAMPGRHPEFERSGNMAAI
jgi:hypothetical protein